MSALGPSAVGELRMHRGNAQVNEDLKEVREGARRLSEGTASAKALKQECAWDLGGWGGVAAGERVKEGRCRQTGKGGLRGRRGSFCRLHKLS